MPHKSLDFLLSKWNDPNCYNQLGKTPYACAKVGFGSYRVSHEIEDHGVALRQAIHSGFNLIDTSANYANGGSEKLIGKVLKDSDIDREALVIVSKVGYVQGDNYDLARMREDKGTPYGEMVKYSEGLWHCIHPEYIQDQLTLSLGRLDLPYLDFYLLHNPEYYFMHLQQTSRAEDIEKAQFTFYDRVRRAFVMLEDLVEKGKIKYYGVSSNTIAMPTGDFSAVHLPTLLGIAEEIANDKYGARDAHHFAMVQCPINVLEPQALSVAQSDDLSVLEFAKKNKLAVLANRPLNAMQDSRLVRLATFNPLHQNPDIAAKLTNLDRLEKEFTEDFANYIQPIIAKHGAAFKVAQQLSLKDLETISSLQWRDFTGSYFIREVVKLVHSFDPVFAEKVESNNSWSIWKSKYLQALGDLIEHVLAQAELRENKATASIDAAVTQNGMNALATLNFSQKALLAIASLPEVSCVLLGMRHPKYVEDAKMALEKISQVDQTAVRAWLKS